MSEQLAIDFLSHRARSTRRSVFRILTCHRGREQAISMHDIARRLGISSRDVQAIVKHLVEAHGGTVAAESDVGRGTTVRAFFPSAENG